MKAHVVGVLALVLLPVVEAAAQGPQACAAIADPAARLACYDALHAPAPVAPAAPPAVAPVPAPAVSTVAPAPAPPAPDADFGADSLEHPAKPPEPPKGLQARLAQEFRGWEKGTRFALDNGQEWQATGGDEAYYKAVPAGLAVTIEKRWSGGYEMKVEGYPRAIKVRRVR